MSDNGYPDRSKQRSNDSPISLIANTAKSVQNFADSTKEALSAAQTGTSGKFKWSTNLLDMLGGSLYGGLTGKQSMGGIGKSAIEKSLFGIDFNIDESKTIGFETRPAPQGRDYKLTFTKKF